MTTASSEPIDTLPNPWQQGLGGVFLLLVCLSILWAGVQLYQVATDASLLPIDEVVLVGERRYTQDDAVRQALHQLDQVSLFAADVDSVQQVLTDLPWVDRVKVRREWPNRLRLYLTEQEIKARWQGQNWLNSRIEPFAASLSTQGDPNWPDLYGPTGSEQTVWQMWSDIQFLLNGTEFKVQKLELDPRYSWTLELVPGHTLLLGRQDTLLRLQRFVDTWSRVDQQPQAIAQVDLRYDTGFAVNWQQQEKKLKDE